MGSAFEQRPLDRPLKIITSGRVHTIPEEFREAIGDRIFGCDDCLAVCPWNRFTQATSARIALPLAYVRETRSEASSPSPLRSYAPSFQFPVPPVKRIKRPCFLRNVCVALGNIGLTEDLGSLAKAAQNHEPLIAEAACWGALHRLERRPRAQRGTFP